MDEADVSALIGRHFVGKSGNVCVIERLGVGAIRARWKRQETENDREELTAWVQGILGPVEATVSVGRDREAAALAEWRKAGRSA